MIMQCDSPWLIRNDFTPYEQGQGDVDRSHVIRMSANENPRGPSPRVLSELRAIKGGVLSRYPADGAPALRSDIAARLRISPSQVYTAAGSAGVIKTIAERTLEPGTSLICSELSFPYYAIAASQLGATVIRVPVRTDMSDDLDAMLCAVDSRSRVLFLASPNNPTGTFIPEDALRAFLSQLPRNVVVGLDLAYIEYADSGYSEEGLELLDAHVNLVLLRSLSKIHGLASLRIGYGIGSPDTIAMLETAAVPFAIGSLAVMTARTALSDTAWISDSALENRTNRALIERELLGLGVYVVPSHANFLLARFVRPNAIKVCEALRDRGIYVRPVRTLPDHLRISIGTAEECKTFLIALQDITRSMA